MGGHTFSFPRPIALKTRWTSAGHEIQTSPSWSFPWRRPTLTHLFLVRCQFECPSNSDETMGFGGDFRNGKRKKWTSIHVKVLTNVVWIDAIGQDGRGKVTEFRSEQGLRKKNGRKEGDWIWRRLRSDSSWKIEPVFAFFMRQKTTSSSGDLIGSS